VSVDLWRDRIHAVIGPNGAGKSTLTNLLSGDLPTTSGHRSRWPGATSPAGHPRDLAPGPGPQLPEDQHLCALHRLGKRAPGRAVARCATALEPAALASDCRQVRHGPARQPAIELAGLESRRNVIAGASSHGEQRQLEIAMTLATEPQVLLLDEPLAGMGVAEAERMVELLLKLKKDHAMLLVEHDMDAIFALADHLTVMVNGQVIASGSPAAVRADRGVQAAYLGEEH
jgi:branched-chain amino acid transport system ATP-binding protein